MGIISEVAQEAAFERAAQIIREEAAKERPFSYVRQLLEDIAKRVEKEIL